MNAITQWFVNPAWLLALPPVLGLITALYFLKMKRREVLVASTWLWRQAIQDMRVNSPFQRLRMNLLLFLQLLIAALIIFALARPRAAVGNLGGRNLVLVIDRSASMGALSAGGESRFETARREATKLINDMSESDEAILLTFDDKPRILANLTSDRRLLLKALEDIKLSARSTSLNEALELAFKLNVGRADEERDVYLFSDGICRELGPSYSEEEINAGTAVIKPSELTAHLPEGVTLRFVSLGEASPNLGITGISLRRTLNEDALLQLFIGIGNFGAGERSVGVDITLDGQLIESREVTLAAEAVTSVIVDSEALKSGRVGVSLDAKDSLAIDNKAYAIAQDRAEMRALLVSEGNHFLENALRSMPFVDVRIIEPGSYDATDPDLAAFDMILFDRVQPSLVPPVCALYINTLPPLKHLEWGVGIKDPQVINWDESHPVTAYVNFNSLEPLEMKLIKLSENEQVIVDGEQGPMIFSVRDSGRESLVLAFDILQSAWPFQASFPIFLANALRWLGGEGQGSRQARTGESVVLSVGAGGGTLKVTDPEGEVFEQQLEEGERVTAFTKTDKPGFYRAEVLRGGKAIRTQDFAVNLASSLESHLRPRDEMSLAGQKRSIKASDGVATTNREVWRIIAWTLLVVLLGEWWIYNRRLFV